MLNNDEYYMDLALKEAKRAYDVGEVPVGCVIVYDNKVIAKGHNQRIKDKSLFGHAEIVAIKKANKVINDWRLDDCTLYVTLEPCVMCTGAIIQSRISRVVYATKEPKFGAMGSIIDLTNQDLKFNHHVMVSSGVREMEAQNLIKSFFKDLRSQKK